MRVSPCYYAWNGDPWTCRAIASLVLIIMANRLKQVTNHLSGNSKMSTIQVGEWLPVAYMRPFQLTWRSYGHREVGGSPPGSRRPVSSRDNAETVPVY